MKRKLKVNDFFCGCGGMGIAFKNAGYIGIGNTVTAAVNAANLAAA